MKIRKGFVSNSSSSSFIIKNQTYKHKTMEDFAKETCHLVLEFNNEYSWNNHTVEEFMDCVDQYDNTWHPGEEKYLVFGDDDGTVMGKVYDYMLREGDSSKSFSWYYKESLR